VPPSVRVAADPPGPIKVNKTMNMICLVKGFYPGDVAITWLENGTEVKVENNSHPVKTSLGLFELRSQVEVQATAEKNGSVFTCQVVHDAQAPISRMATLQIAGLAIDNGVNLLLNPGLWLGILLEKGLLGGLLIFLFKARRA
ncbi:SIRBL protein, partial [Rhynochetos jubatus]|nr:SIRBL protein [Rhynochetos jubatus]